MKKFPVFHNSKTYTELFRKMGTKYNKEIVSSWEEIEEDLLKKLINDGEIEINFEEIEEFLDNDDFFRVQDKPIVLYIRDQYAKYYERGYKYHIYNCKTIKEAIKNRRKNRYVFKYAFNTEKKFVINLLDGVDETGKDIYKKKNLNEDLNVCKNCLKETNHESYDQKNYIQKKLIYESFDYKDFFENKESYRLALLNFKSFEDAEINEYGNEWPKISADYRASKKWTCEECNIDLTENRRYLHTHHIDCSKPNNKIWNLKALCIECHAKKPKHGWIRNNPDYRKFKELDIYKKRGPVLF